jgi:hypothetical protein
MAGNGQFRSLLPAISTAETGAMQVFWYPLHGLEYNRAY